MGTLPLTSTPSISEIIMGLKGLNLGLSSSTSFFILLAIELTLGFIETYEGYYNDIKVAEEGSVLINQLKS